jgi:N-acetylneuraminate synthase
MGTQAALIAAAMGAVAIEKHITNDPMRQGPDHRFSATPDILLDISKAVAEVALARGGGAKATSAVEADNKVVGRRSAFALRDLPTGHLVVREDFRFVRPGVGIPPNDAGALVGQRLARDVPKGHPITYDAISRRGMT